MCTKQIIGSTPSLGYSLWENLLLPDSGNGAKRTENNSTHMSTLLILLFTVTLLTAETLNVDRVITTVEPIETKYAFNSLDECNAKLTQLQKDTGVKGLRCETLAWKH